MILIVNVHFIPSQISVLDLSCDGECWWIVSQNAAMFEWKSDACAGGGSLSSSIPIEFTSTMPAVYFMEKLRVQFLIRFHSCSGSLQIRVDSFCRSAMDI